MKTAKNSAKRQVQNSLTSQWLPAIVAGVVLFAVPPVAIAIIVAYFAAPLIKSIHQSLRLPLAITTLIVMTIISLIFYTFLFFAYNGLLDTIPIVEKHLAPYTKNADIAGKIILFIDEKMLQYGHEILEFVITFTQKLFQQLFSLFIFLIALFFALKESGKNRFWFLVYFPSKMRKNAKKFFTEAGDLIGTFLGIEARLFFLSFLIMTTCFYFLKFESPIGNAFLIALVDSVPFLGIGLFLVPMAIFFFYSGNLFVGISLIILYLFTMTTRQVAESYMWASTFQLKPVHAFIITACAIYLFGLIGILLTPFLLFATLKVRNHSLFT